MKRELIKAAAALSRGRRRAYVSRVAWLDLELLVRAAYDEISVLDRQLAELGNVYLTSNRNYPPLNAARYGVVDVINQIQLQVGWRQLNVRRAIAVVDAEPKQESLAESGATLWFSQDVSGAVMVFVAPYKSPTMRMNEENIILARYRNAMAVSASDVRRHFATYFRYCEITSAHGDMGLGGYLYRLRLRYKDLRFKSDMRSHLWRPLEFLVIIIATLYAGGKLFGT